MAPLPTKTSIGEKPPTSESGYASLMVPLVGWNQYSIGSETVEDEVPDLRWPVSVNVYHKMRTDAQIDALLKAIFLPVRRRRWVIDPNGARDEAVEQVASDFGLPIKGTDEPPPRGRRRFNHDDHIRHALLGTIYGHMMFEEVGAIDKSLMWRMQKLAPRMPQSIAQILIDDVGDFDGIIQKGSKNAGTPIALPLPLFGIGKRDPIPAKWLAPYVWDREGANWYGRSLLRPIYKHWLLKDRIMRIDAMRHEKLGLGVPMAKAPKGANERVIQEYAEAMKNLKANPDAGYGLPDGASMEIGGPPRGSLPDTIASMKYHDEQMSRDFLAMFMQLGTTESGSRALGITFSDFFSLSVDAICGWYATVTNETVIEDQIDWNFGTDEQCPLMAWEDKKDDPIAVTDLILLIKNNLLVVDEDLQAWARQNWDLPAPGGAVVEPSVPTGMEEMLAQQGNISNLGDAAGQTPDQQAAAATRERIRVHMDRRVAAASQTHGSTMARHRERTPHEVTAATNFDQMQAEWNTTTTSLIDAWADVQKLQIDALVESVRGAVGSANAEGLASISAPVLGTDVIESHMMSMAEASIAAARAEAVQQGVDIPLVNVAEIEASISARAGAVAALAARSLAQTAANQALMRYGITLNADEVADAVRAHLEGLSDAWLTDTLGGALTQAQNLGRITVMGQRPGTYYASELLDNNTCSNCAAVDGRSYDSIDAALEDYPAGGFGECLGGPRCRGTLVAVYDEAVPGEIPA